MNDSPIGNLSVSWKLSEFLPVALFAILPLVLLALASKFGQLFIPVLIAGALIAIVFFFYIIFFRREKTTLVGASLPTIFGPLLALLFIRGMASPLDKAIQAGGSEVIQLAFFFAGAANLAIYLFSKLGVECRTDERILTYLGGALFILFVILIISYGSNFAPPHGFSVIETSILEWMVPQDLSPLTKCRGLLAWYSVVFATWPHPK